jgi:hypothetical protein
MAERLLPRGSRLHQDGPSSSEWIAEAREPLLEGLYMLWRSRLYPLDCNNETSFSTAHYGNYVMSEENPALPLPITSDDPPEIIVFQCVLDLASTVASLARAVQHVGKHTPMPPDDSRVYSSAIDDLIKKQHELLGHCQMFVDGQRQRTPRPGLLYRWVQKLSRRD